MKVSVRGGFSDRNKIKPENTMIQNKEFDKRTRIQLYNMIINFYEEVYKGYSSSASSIQDFLGYVRVNIYSEMIGPYYTHSQHQIFSALKDTFLNGTYDDVLTVIESLVIYLDEYLKDTNRISYYDAYYKQYTKLSLYQLSNEYFKREFVGYRFVDNKIMPISDSIEIDSIEECLGNKLKPVTEHISKANKFLADRTHPDYENSIKESISAVEAMCEIITGLTGKEATLGNMLKKLEDKGIEIHKVLKSAFNKLYGYTSDANGIRHAGDIGGSSSTFEEAKFMLVTCCAFINYLTALNAD
jgi:hypothetical protein